MGLQAIAAIGRYLSRTNTKTDAQTTMHLPKYLSAMSQRFYITPQNSVGQHSCICNVRSQMYVLLASSVVVHIESLSC
jgi:hypothetical protein